MIVKNLQSNSSADSASLNTENNSMGKIHFTFLFFFLILSGNILLTMGTNETAL
jgi:hypothetical protein